jgi:hypothetical protein
MREYSDFIISMMEVFIDAAIHPVAVAFVFVTPVVGG